MQVLYHCNVPPFPPNLLHGYLLLCFVVTTTDKSWLDLDTDLLLWVGYFTKYCVCMTIPPAITLPIYHCFSVTTTDKSWPDLDTEILYREPLHKWAKLNKYAIIFLKLITFSLRKYNNKNMEASTHDAIESLLYYTRRFSLLCGPSSIS